MGLSQDLNKSLLSMEYTTPTPIQAQAIPMALDGHDILGSAQTGTGKTAAFSIPLVEAMLNNTSATSLILTPTRELAKQVLDVVRQLLGPKSSIKTAFIIGGEPIGKQFQQLKMQPRIIVGTPGRVNDHLERGTLNLSQTSFLVLDETDRMLDMGFGIQLDAIVKYLPKKRQTLMFSATLPQGIIKLSQKYLNNPQRISMGETNVVAKNIKQEVMHIEQDRKYDELVSQLHAREGSVIVFAKTKHGSDKIAKNLRRDGFESDALHGDLRQNKRTQVMKRFQQEQIRVLVATDIASRGLDVPHIRHVINYDLPQVPEDYIHRMGRTARAGADGEALCFVASHDGRLWHAIERLLGIRTDKPANDRNKKRGGGRKKASFQGRDAGRGKPIFKKRNDENENNRGDRPAYKGKDESRGDRPSYKNRDENRGDRPAFKGKKSEGQDDRSSFKGRGRDDNRKSFEGNKKPFKDNERDGNRPARPYKDADGNKKPFKRSDADGQKRFEKRTDSRTDTRNGSGKKFEGRDQNKSRSFKSNDGNGQKRNDRGGSFSQKGKSDSRGNSANQTRFKRKSSDKRDAA